MQELPIERLHECSPVDLDEPLAVLQLAVPETVVGVIPPALHAVFDPIAVMNDEALD